MTELDQMDRDELLAYVRQLRDGIEDAACDAYMDGARGVGRMLEALLD